MQTDLIMKWMGRRLGLRVALTAWRHRGLDPHDIFLASYPKSGNTWLAFLIATVLTGEETDFDRVGDVVPGVAYHKGRGYMLPAGGRIIRTHEMWRPAYGRGIYMVRDGRDVAVSYYHHHCATGMFSGGFSEFFRWFASGSLDGYGAWDKNVESWLRQIDVQPEAFLLLRYEDLLNNPASQLESVLVLLGIGADRERIEFSVRANEKDRMRKKENDSRFLRERMKLEGATFVRSASPGQWDKYFSEKDLAMFEQTMGEVNARLGYA